MQNFRLLSIMSAMMLTQIMIMFIGTFPPFKDKSQNTMELINELFVLLTNYHLILFTDFLSDVNRRENVGASLVITVCACILINILVVVFGNIAIISRKLKLAWLLNRSNKKKKWLLYQKKIKLLKKQAELRK